jgi:valyl-tRNA synthetase
MVKECTEYFDRYEYSKTKNSVEKFFWQDICDFYLELSKDRLYNPDKRGKNGRKSAQFTLYTLILNTIKMFAPIMPHITEEIYQKYFKKHEKTASIHVSGWPLYTKKLDDGKAEISGKLIDFIVEQTRKAKSEKNVSLKESVKKISVEAKMTEADFGKIRDDIKGVTHAETIEFRQMDAKSEEDFKCSIEL